MIIACIIHLIKITFASPRQEPAIPNLASRNYTSRMLDSLEHNVTIAEASVVYPGLTPEQQEESEDSLDRSIDVRKEDSTDWTKKLLTGRRDLGVDSLLSIQRNRL